MLSYPDRHKFEEIRSWWEAAQGLGGESKMVGRKEKPVIHPPLKADDGTNASKFRRKLSHGLSFISLSQRRTTPVRPSLHSNGLTNVVDIAHPRETTSLLSRMRNPSLHNFPVQYRAIPKNNASPEKSLDPNATPKQLPRSRTMSFIPRPSRSGSGASGTEADLAPTPRPPASTLGQEVRATSKIPSPDPSAAPSRRLSPRQCHSNFTAQQEKRVAAGNALAGVSNPSPSKASVRSYTTPNPLKEAHSPGSNISVAPRKTSHHRLSGIPAPQRQILKENATPTSQQHMKRLSNIQEQSPRWPKRQSLVAPTAASKRPSIGPAGALAQGKHGVCTTPPSANKRRSSQGKTQTSLAAQRAWPKTRSHLHPIGSLPASNDSFDTQTRLLGPVSPPTPPPIDHASARPTLPRAITDKDLRKHTFSTPYKRTGGGMFARSQAGAYREVRFPRSSTYHHFVGGLEHVPPVPQIPEQYKSVSMPILDSTQGPTEGSNLHWEQTGVHERVQGQNLDEISFSSTDSSSITDSEMCGLDDRRRAILADEIRRARQSLLAKSKSKLHIPIPEPGPTYSSALLLSANLSDLGSTRTGQLINSADIGVPKQVKDYMPLLYWAGRFQSRYDQWRTEAMQVELNPGYVMEGPLAHCNLSQDKVAICHIFLQLRDLCLSNQAADSLWEFEYKFRRDHNLLGASSNLPPLNPKPDDGTSKQGSFGRAVRKMTPRKSSFVNLLKGKGWNKEELKSTEGSTEYDLTFPTTFDSSEKEY